MVSPPDTASKAALISFDHAVPLTQPQEGLWAGQHLDPQNPIYNTGEYIEIHGALDIEHFSNAVAQVMQEASVLALQVAPAKASDHESAGAVQWTNKAHLPVLEVIDLRQKNDPESIAKAAMQQDMETPLNLQASPLAVQHLYRLSDTHYYWYQRAHHLLLDGWGQSLINTRVAAVYNEEQAQQPLGSYQSWLDEDKSYKGSDQENKDREFWVSSFQDTPVVTDLSLGKGCVAVTASTALSFQMQMPAEFEDTLTQVCEQERQTWPDVLTALTAAYIARYSMSSGSADSVIDETVIGVPYMGRMGSACARVPATVMNVLPLKVAVDSTCQLSEYIHAVSRQLRKIRRHGRYRSEQLRRDLGLLGGHKRLYGAVVNVLPFDDVQLELSGLKAIRHPLGNGPVEDLTITFRANALGQHMRLEIDANPNRYDFHDVEVHVHRLIHFLMQAVQVNEVKDKEKAAGMLAEKLADVSTLLPAEYQQWVYDCNATTHDLPPTTLAALLAERWSQILLQIPEKTALKFEGIALSYAQLQAETARLAKRLNDAGVKRGDIVAVAMPRSLELVVALVAILRAGAAYLPLDIESPAQRLATIIQTAQPRLILASQQMKNKLPEESNVLVFELDLDELMGGQTGMQVCEFTEPDLQPHDMAYVLFTSGSTGTPKGVVVEHDAIVNRLLWMEQHYAISADERILQKTPVTFDVSVWEFFLPLIAGATLVVAPRDAHKDPQQLMQIMQKSHITVLHFVPSMLSMFLAYYQMDVVQSGQDGAFFNDLRLVFCSGEALPSELCKRFHATIGGADGAELHNLYGPTEAAVDVSYWPVAADDNSQPVPIGFPVWNTQLYILDKNLQPVPPGIAGSLYIAGRQLARGYLGRQDLTDKAFGKNPFIPHERMYATGDLARWRDDGAVVFLGRSDFQIKIRGQRVELEEIEAVIARIEGVKEVALIAQEYQPGDQRIVAYVVLTKNIGLDESRLKEITLEYLAPYMIPNVFVMMQALPVNGNGKLDRKALPVPVFARQTGGREPSTQTEKQLVALYAQVLGQKEPVYTDDDFFVLGGHSLLAAELMLAIQAQWGYTIGLGALFEHPTPAQLAVYLDKLGASGATNAAGQAEKAGHEGFGHILMLNQAATKVAANGEKSTLPALFCIHPAGGLGWCYSTLARSVDANRAVIGLQSPELDLAVEFPASMDAMACRYVDEIVRLQPQGPYHLLGWSIGGIIAQAMAVELQKRSLPLGVITMLDAYPSDCWRGEAEMQESAAYKALMHIAGYDPKHIEGMELTHDKVIAFLRQSGHPLGFLSDELLQGITRVVRGNNRLVKAYSHEYLHSPVLYFRAALDHEGENLYPDLWKPYVAQLDVYDMPSLHAHLVSVEMVKKIAPILNKALVQQELEGKSLGMV